MLTLELDYTKWRCGERSQRRRAGYPDADSVGLGSGITMLLAARTLVTRDDGSVEIPPHSCCCLGLMLMAAGADPVHLRGSVGPVSAAEVMQFPYRAGSLPTGVRELLQRLVRLVSVDRNALQPTDIAYAAFNINDGVERYSDREMSVAQRMASLTVLFRYNGVAELVWTNVPDDVKKTYEEELSKYADEA